MGAHCIGYFGREIMNQRSRWDQSSSFTPSSYSSSSYRNQPTSRSNNTTYGTYGSSASNSISSTRVPYASYSTTSQPYSARNFSSRISSGTGGSTSVGSSYRNTNLASSYASELRNSSRPSSGGRTNYSYTPSNAYGSNASLRNAYSRKCTITRIA